MRDYRRQMIHRAYFVLHRLITPAMLPEVSGSFPESNTGAVDRLRITAVAPAWERSGMGKSTRFQLVT